MRKIELKTIPEYFDKVAKGLKKFEIRYNDRDYKAGDILILKEWVPEEKAERDENDEIIYPFDIDKPAKYTGRQIACKVVYILSGFEGLADGYIAMQLVLFNDMYLGDKPIVIDYSEDEVKIQGGCRKLVLDIVDAVNGGKFPSTTGMSFTITESSYILENAIRYNVCPEEALDWYKRFVETRVSIN